MMIRLTAAAVLLLAAGPALADKAAADKCAAGLAPDAKAIYTASAPEFAAAPDGKAVVKAKTQALVKAGTVSMGGARSAAMAAGGCLKLLK